MEYKSQKPQPSGITPQLIIHGGAGNIQPANLAPIEYQEYRKALLTIISKSHAYMHTRKPSSPSSSPSSTLPTALETATLAVTLLENNPLFNSGHGAVFTRDGINELEASVMVSRGRAKRGAGVIGLRRVKNPVLLARAVLEHGEDDLLGRRSGAAESSGEAQPDAPSAQGHTLVSGPTAEVLARKYGLEMVDPGYFFTQKRWDEHVRGLERERRGQEATASWSGEEYLPQGTVGAVALDADGVVCAATSTGGLTNKLTGRVGDTPIPGAGYWAEEWEAEDHLSGRSWGSTAWERGMEYIRRPGSAIELAGALKGMMADCFPTPFMYSPVKDQHWSVLTTSRSIAVSGTGNGDSFLRVNAARTVAAIARWKQVSSAEALHDVAGPLGELQKSAGDRWKQTGEGEGGIIGIESVVVRDAEGTVVETRGEVLQDFNCTGMFRAWIDENGKAVVRIWREDDEAALSCYDGEGRPEDVRKWMREKDALDVI